MAWGEYGGMWGGRGRKVVSDGPFTIMSMALEESVQTSFCRLSSGSGVFTV